MGDEESIRIREFRVEDIPLSCSWIVVGPPGSGKCLARNTPVVMYDGSIKYVQDVEPGDVLMGDDSTPRNVLSTTHGRDNLYTIRPNAGRMYTVNTPHILCLKRIPTLEIEEISVEDFIRLPREVQAEYRTYFTSIEYQDTHPLRNAYELAYNETLQGNKGLGKYLCRSKADRKAALAGIIDNNCTPEQGEESVDHASIRTTSQRCAMDLKQLAASLGFFVKVKVSYTNSTNPVYTVGIYSSDIISIDSLPYTKVKICETVIQSAQPFTVDHTGYGDYYGFQIDGNRRFLLALDNYVVTHNTTFIENMAYYLKHRYPVARVFMGTDGGYKQMCKIFHPLFVSNYYDETEEKNNILRQRTCEMENGKYYYGNYSINILDDVSDDPKIYKTKVMRGLFKLGSQHWNQLLFVGSQYAIDMPPDIRKSVSYVAIFREPEEGERQKLYKNFGGLAGSYANFCDLMDQLTGDYTCLIFQKRGQSNNKEDNIFYFRTKMLNPWRFGCKEYHEWGKDRYDESYVEEIIM